MVLGYVVVEDCIVRLRSGVPPVVVVVVLVVELVVVFVVVVLRWMGAISYLRERRPSFSRFAPVSTESSSLRQAIMLLVAASFLRCRTKLLPWISICLRMSSMSYCCRFAKASMSSRFKMRVSALITILRESMSTDLAFCSCSTVAFLALLLMDSRSS